MSNNPEVQMSLSTAVDEVLGQLTGLDLSYDPGQERYRAIVRQINRALRLNALESEWSWYASEEVVGRAMAGDSSVTFRSTVRPRIVGDDSARLVKPDTGATVTWAYFLPRDALHKYRGKQGLWVSHIRNTLQFSRPLLRSEDGLDIVIPVQREPRMFQLPPVGEEVPEYMLDEIVDFWYPDLVTMRAAFLYAQTDPVMQTRVQTLEALYKDLMYQCIERDGRHTDSAYENEFILPIDGPMRGQPEHGGHPHNGGYPR